MIQSRLAQNKMLLLSWRWLSQIIDPIALITGAVRYARYFSDWHTYSRLLHAEPISIFNTYPRLHERTSMHSFDAHYFYTNGWAMRRVLSESPNMHIDIGSQVIFANLLAAIVPVTFIDYRPLKAKMEGLECLGGDILALPFDDGAINSLSCLHVAEHIGLGRYGDPLDPDGTRKAAKELARVLAPGGNLYFVVPVGKPRLCFNAHRIHAPLMIRDYFADLELLGFSGVDDDGQFIERVDLARFRNSTYACGMFWFRKPEDSK